MKLVCPGCGGTYSLEAWENDAAVRQLNGVMSALPHQVQEHAARYLGLFRIGARGLSWKRALRILQELKDLVGTGNVHWEGGETRPAPPGLWAEAMLEMCEKGKRELESHNYLRKVVWTRAAPLARQAERDAETGRGPGMERRGDTGRERADAEKGRHGDAGTAASPPKKRGCFCCEAFRPPKGCAAKSRPASGNQMLGCGQWMEKTTARVAGLMGDLAAGLKEILHGTSEE
jgi:hypothetical protein